MTSSGLAGATLRLAALASLAGALSACSMGSMFGGGPDSPSIADANATPAQIAQGQASALPAIATACPDVKVQPGAEALFNYGGSRPDPTALHYQAEFDKQTRNCVVSNGLITVKLGVAGRVLLGPAGKESAVTVPLRVTVDRNNNAVFSERYAVAVPIDPQQQSGSFVKIVDNIAIPYLTGDDIDIYVGFDSGNGRSAGRG